MMLWQQGLGYYNAEGQVTVDSPENIATLETLVQFWDADLTSDQLAIGKFGGGTHPINVSPEGSAATALHRRRMIYPWPC